MSRRPLERSASRALAVALGLAVVVIAALLLFHRLGAGSLRGDELIHGAVAREAATSGSWLPLRLGDGLYLSKPPLKLLAQAAVFRFFGVTSFTARALDAASGVALVLAIYLFALAGPFAGRRGAPWAAALGALLPLTAPGWVFRHHVREGTQDAAFGLLLALSLFAWFLHAEGRPRRRAGLLASAALAGLAMLVKGPVGLVVLPVLLVYEAALARLADPAAPARPWSPLAHAGLAAILPAAYGAYLAAVAGERLVGALYRDLVVRATAGLDPGHLHGPWAYAGWVAGDFGLWLLLVPVALAAAVLPGLESAVAAADGAAGRRRRAVLFLAGWALVVLVVFSLPASKLPWYVFPAYPALALLVAAGAAAALARLPRPFAAAAGAVLALALTAGLEVTWSRARQPREVARVERIAAAMREDGDFRLLAKRGMRANHEVLFHLGPEMRTVWAIPRGFWRDDGTCRYLLRHAPWPRAAGGVGPRSVRLTAPAAARPLWLVDVDRCLDPAVAAEPGE